MCFFPSNAAWPTALNQKCWVFWFANVSKRTSNLQNFCLRHLMSKVLILFLWPSPDEVCLAFSCLVFPSNVWSDVWRACGRQLRNHLSSQGQEVQLWLVQFRTVLIARLIRNECFPLASLGYYEFIPSLHAHWVSDSWYQVGISCHRFPVVSIGQDAYCFCILCTLLPSVLTGKGPLGWFFYTWSLSSMLWVCFSFELNVCFMTAYGLVIMALTGQ